MEFDMRLFLNNLWYYVIVILGGFGHTWFNQIFSIQRDLSLNKTWHHSPLSQVMKCHVLALQRTWHRKRLSITGKLPLTKTWHHHIIQDLA